VRDIPHSHEIARLLIPLPEACQELNLQSDNIRTVQLSKVQYRLADVVFADGQVLQNEDWPIVSSLAD
jgi:hypothetical protein